MFAARQAARLARRVVRPAAAAVASRAVAAARARGGVSIARRAMATAAAAGDKRESMDFDVVIVGAGPAGLSAAIRLKQLAQKNNRELSVCVVEKGAEIGSHILSGNVFEPRYLNELIPDWKQKGAPLNTPVTTDKLVFLTEKHSMPLAPTPPSLNNHGNYIISLGSLVRWLGAQAQELGVELYPGFAASEVLYSSTGHVEGIATNDQGVSKAGAKLDTYQRGMELRAQQTLFAEGARGSLSELVMQKFDLRKGRDPQHFGLGVKEVWEIDPAKHSAGSVTHTIGWPLDTHTYGGSFMYHMKPNLLLLGFVVGLDYANPYISPYEEMQRFKHHPAVKHLFEGSKCISYGARVINEGGVQSIPKLTFPGGALIGCSAGFVNLPKIKGSHNAMKSGMVAAESLFTEFTKAKDANGSLAGTEVSAYETNMRKSPVWAELNEVRNIGPAFHKFGGLFGWSAYSALELFVTKGRVPWTLRNPTPDSEATGMASDFEPIEYPKPDGKISFDLLTNLQRSGVNHNEDQPVHLRVRQGMESVPVEWSHRVYAGPESRFCPARVYEYVPDPANTSHVKLQINAQNCVHCKTCDIKPPKNFIQWTVPEGGGGPAYENM